MTLSRLASLALALSLCLAVPEAVAVPFWGAKESRAAGTAPADLKPGEWLWLAQAAPSGPVVVVVSLSEQRAYAYRNGVVIGISTTSSGKQGYETPTGVFTILQKDKDHHSSIYNNAAMPYTQRLTWGGVALHAGGLPGYPSSHGCVHLPSEFARLLFEVSPMGMTVVVAQEGKSPEDVVHPGLFSPVDAATGADDLKPRLPASQDYRWQPEASPEGPVTLLLSGADRRLLVFRGGKEIGRARITLRDPATPLGTQVLVVKDGDSGQPDPFASGQTMPLWFSIGVPGHETDTTVPLDAQALQRIDLAPEFAMRVRPLLTPGVSVLVTDAPVLPGATGGALDVLTSAPPEDLASN
ncbi:L,D-transpeptidase [Arenimonas sp. MALMAid1274]|uniref:L,D-transpeptidase n=1 Tax=Arenimonas sp. MALMAid1274 TaxID=3411630 RepID=UPI003BA06E8E